MEVPTVGIKIHEKRLGNVRSCRGGSLPASENDEGSRSEVHEQIVGGAVSKTTR